MFYYWYAKIFLKYYHYLLALNDISPTMNVQVDYDPWMPRPVFLKVSIRTKLPLFHILGFVNRTLNACIVSLLKALRPIVAL